jgi:hypothetical protein
MAQVALAAAALGGVEDLGKAVARQRWLLTPAATVATAARGRSSVDVCIGIGSGGRGGGGHGSSGGGGHRR